jgi:Yip1 domain
LIKVTIYGAIAGALAFLWSILNIGMLTGGMFGGHVGIMVFVSYIIGSIIGLFIGAVILLIISSICKGNTDFEANVRVTAGLMVVMPISAFFGFAIGINLYLGIIISLAVNIFALWLLYNGLVEALKSKPETAKIVLYVLIAIFVLFTLMGLGTRSRTYKYMNEFKNPDFKERLKDMEKK